jgi:uncharacterized protein YcbX
MRGKISSLWRYPVKGFTPEQIRAATLLAGGFFPGDRLYAVEDGPSGFDPATPAWVSKQKFTVLAKIAQVARAHTSYDEASGVLVARADHRDPFTGALSEADGQKAFAAWLAAFLGDAARGPLRVLQAPGHRFTDHPHGHVSIINLASVRDLEARTGRPVDPLRFRANLYVEGWPAWVENDLDGAALQLGAAAARVFSPIVRCAATHVNPATGERDFDLVAALHAHYGTPNCGIYVTVTRGGVVSEADVATIGSLGV